MLESNADGMNTSSSLIFSSSISILLETRRDDQHHSYAIKTREQAMNE